METTAVLRTLAVMLGFVAAALMAPEAVGMARHAKAANRANAAAFVDQAALLARLLRNGLPPCTAAARGAMRIPWADSLFREASWLARNRGYETDPSRCGGVLLGAAAVVAFLGLAASSSAVFGLTLSACLIGALAIYAKQAHERQMEDMRESLPDVLRTMSACFRSGYSLLQTFRHLAAETHGPLGAVFVRAAGDLETGQTTSSALKRLREESALSEFAFVMAALEIQHQTGGSMQTIIDSACDSIEGELALRRSLRVQTAQARLSMRIVTIMPFVLMAVFSLISPEFLAPFFSSLTGIAVFCAAMGMQAAGVLMVRRMLDVKEA